MVKNIFVMLLLLCWGTVQAYPGYEADRQQRDWMMNTAFAPLPKPSKRSIDYNRVFGYVFYNKSGRLISKIKFQHTTSRKSTSVDTSSYGPRIRQKNGLGLSVIGVRNNANNKWEYIEVPDRDLYGRSSSISVYQIKVPVYGANSKCCINTSGSVYIQIVWNNGTVKNYLLPRPCGDVTVYDDHIYVHLGVSGLDMSFKKIIYPQGKR